MIFQPHLFSRTKDLINEFADSLSKVDEIIIIDIYALEKILLVVLVSIICLI